ncbi:MAG: pyrimidine reductase family protein [Actinomycetota bacterium]|nr:pyrimidine reductase family protein [Actinomycetota bacterium]
MTALRPVAMTDLDAEALYLDAERVPLEDRPWVLANMIVTIDGATTIGDVSGPLGNEDDRRVLRLLRACADVILVAAGTVRAERYRAPSVDEHLRQRRVDAGQAANPRLAIVSRSLDLDPTAPPFSDAAEDARPIVVTATGADRDQRARLAEVADLLDAGEESVDIATALGGLAARGARVVLCEGGPSLNGQLVAAGVVDEICTTISPRLVGGPSPRLAHAEQPAEPITFEVAHVVTSDDLLFVRYVRSDGDRDG